MNTSTYHSFERLVADHTHDMPAVALHHDGLDRAAGARAEAWSQFHDPVALRDAAASIRAGDVRRLDALLEDFSARFEKAGGRLHWAPEATDARDALAAILRGSGVKKGVRAHSATLAEIEADSVFKAAGVTVEHTEFGELMNHFSGDAPSHPVYVACHQTREQLAALLHNKGGEAVARTAEELADLVRRRLRPQFLDAELGVIGANFLVADSGHMVLAENEGNLRLVASLPRVLVIVAGIDKVTASVDNLPVLLAALSAAGAGRIMMPSVTMLAADSPRCCGLAAREVHLILLDNGRSARLANSAKAETLRCIGCGACSDVCPVYRLAGGKSFGLRAPGPFGLATELLASAPQSRRQLALATPLCGACVQACPVGIDLHGALVAVRSEPGQVVPGLRLRFLLSIYLWAVQGPRRFAFGVSLFKKMMVISDFIRDAPVNPMAGWSRDRLMPPSPDRTFRNWWKQTGGAASPAARKD